MIGYKWAFLSSGSGDCGAIWILLDDSPEDIGDAFVLVISKDPGAFWSNGSRFLSRKRRCRLGVGLHLTGR